MQSMRSSPSLPIRGKRLRGGCGSCPTESDASKKLPFLTFLRHRSVGPLGSMGEWAYGEPRQGVDAHRYGSGTPGENFLGSHLASAN